MKAFGISLIFVIILSLLLALFSTNGLQYVAIGTWFYCVAGWFIGATLFKAPSRKWTDINTNLSDFNRSVSPLGHFVYSFIWPLILIIEGIIFFRNRFNH